MATNIITYRGYKIYCNNHEYFLTIRSLRDSYCKSEIYFSKTLFRMKKLIDEIVEYQYIGSEYDTMRIKAVNVNNSLNWIKKL